MVFVTTTVVDWRPIFVADRSADVAAAQLHETTAYFGVSIVGWVIMVTHIHALLGFPAVERLSRFMQSFKSLSVRKLCTASGTAAALWKPRFDDLIVWSEEQFRVKLEYTHNNPVKAGLVEDPCDYRWSSAKDWLLDEVGVMPVVKTWGWV